MKVKVKKTQQFDEAQYVIERDRLIDDIERYEIARNGWVIWLAYLGLDANASVDDAMKIMIDLQEKANIAKEGISKLIKSSSNGNTFS